MVGATQLVECTTFLVLTMQLSRVFSVQCSYVLLYLSFFGCAPLIVHSAAAIGGGDTNEASGEYDTCAWMFARALWPSR